MQETEGMTLVLHQADADRFGWPYDFLAGWITLQVHSDLAAVGLTARISAELAQAEIACNMIAGYYHDHLFVPVEKVDQTMKILYALINKYDQS